MTAYYDIIGDIHGQYQKLINLLRFMGYEERDGSFSHPHRQVIFLGDFIDRGPQQKAVLDLVMAMVQRGDALAVMGNHEFNALAFHTPDPNASEAWLRPRTDKNIMQHMAFLAEYLEHKNESALAGVLGFFKSLPLWLDLPGLRIIHACWDESAMNNLAPLLDDNNCLTDEALVQASYTGSKLYDAIEVVLKGPEVRLPEGVFFSDKYGTRRRKMRLRWWYTEATTLAEQVVDRGSSVKQLAALNAVPVVGYPSAAPPLFFGHYWFKGSPKLVRQNMACLDYSAATNGALMAYRWHGESSLNANHFCYVENAGSNERNGCEHSSVL